MKNERTTLLLTGFTKPANRLYLSLCLAFICLSLSAFAAETQVLKDIPYKPGTDLTAYEQERCKLDVYLPEQKTGFATLVWFHGGGLTGGKKDDDFTTKICQSLLKGNIAVVSVNYRLSPKAKYPAYVDDAAAAFAWTYKNIAQHGGDPEKVFISGHSAGGYLTAIVGLDERHVKTYGLKLENIAGLIPISGQMLTHYTIREERGLAKYNVISDDAAPIFHARKETRPMLVLYADKDMETREEENVYFVSTMKAAGNKRVQGLLLKDRTHGTIASDMANAEDPAKTAILNFITEISRERETKKAAK